MLELIYALRGWNRATKLGLLREQTVLQSMREGREGPAGRGGLHRARKAGARGDPWHRGWQQAAGRPPARGW